MGDPSGSAHVRERSSEVLREADTFLHVLRRARFGPVAHRVAPLVDLAPLAWTQWWCHDTWAFDLVDGPGTEVEVQADDGRTTSWERQPGMWHGYPPGCRYRERYRHPQAIREWMWFMVGADLPLPRGRDGCLAIADGEGRLAAYCRAMHAHQQRGGAAGEVALTGLFTAAVGEILAAFGGGAGDAIGTWTRPYRLVAASGSPDLLSRLDDLVCRRLEAPPKVETLAHGLGMSASSLAHRLRAETGVTVVERVRWLRMREARRLLTEGRSTKEVARRLGFSSESYFARVFRATVGMSPEGFGTFNRRAGR